MKTVLVTGATRGIGQAAAIKFKNEGWSVIGVGTKDIQQPAYLDNYIRCDLGDQEQVDLLCQNVQLMNVDALINNAGINIINEFLSINPTDFKKVYDINVYAPFRLSQSVIPYMLKRQWGRIVNISSIWGKKSRSGRASYSASKFAIDGLTIAMADEFAKNRILCNCVAPGFIDTEMTWKHLGPEGVAQRLQQIPINRLGKVEEIADLIYFLGSEKNTYISGQNIAIDGGFTRA